MLFSDINALPTIGIDFKIRKVEVDSKKVLLELLDTAGQERFKTITSLQYRSAMGILLVYDVTNELSFRNIEDWLKNMEKHASQFVCKVLVGTFPSSSMCVWCQQHIPKIDLNRYRVNQSRSAGGPIQIISHICIFIP
jgi:hypothetical protein